MCDVIGDIYGYASELEALLFKLGYRQKGGIWQHSDRKEDCSNPDLLQNIVRDGITWKVSAGQPNSPENTVSDFAFA